MPEGSGIHTVTLNHPLPIAHQTS